MGTTHIGISPSEQARGAGTATYGGSPYSSPAGSPTYSEQTYQTPEEATKEENALQAVYDPSTSSWRAVSDPLLTPGGVSYSQGGAAGGKAGFLTSRTTTAGVQTQPITKAQAYSITSTARQRHTDYLKELESKPDIGRQRVDLPYKEPPKEKVKPEILIQTSKGARVKLGGDLSEKMIGGYTGEKYVSQTGQTFQKFKSGFPLYLDSVRTSGTDVFVSTDAATAKGTTPISPALQRQVFEFSPPGVTPLTPEEKTAQATRKTLTEKILGKDLTTNLPYQSKRTRSLSQSLDTKLGRVGGQARFDTALSKFSGAVAPVTIGLRTGSRAVGSFFSGVSEKTRGFLSKETTPFLLQESSLSKTLSTEGAVKDVGSSDPLTKEFVLSIGTAPSDFVAFASLAGSVPEAVRSKTIVPAGIALTASTFAYAKHNPAMFAAQTAGGAIGASLFFTGVKSLYRKAVPRPISRVEIQAEGFGLEPLKVKKASVKRVGQTVKMEFTGSAPTDLYAAGRYKAKVYGRKSFFNRKEILLGEPTGAYAARVYESPLSGSVYSYKIKGQPVLKGQVYTTPLEFGKGVETIGSGYSFPLDAKGVKRVSAGLIGERSVQITQKTPGLSKLSARFADSSKKFKIKKSQLFGSKLEYAESVNFARPLSSTLTLESPITGSLSSGKGLVLLKQSKVSSLFKKQTRIPVDFKSKFISFTPERVPKFPAPTKFKPFKISKGSGGGSTKLLTDTPSKTLAQELISSQIAESAVKTVRKTTPTKAAVVPVVGKPAKPSGMFAAADSQFAPIQTFKITTGSERMLASLTPAITMQRVGFISDSSSSMASELQMDDGQSFDQITKKQPIVREMQDTFLDQGQKLKLGQGLRQVARPVQSYKQAITQVSLQKQGQKAMPAQALSLEISTPEKTKTPKMPLAIGLFPGDLTFSDTQQKRKSSKGSLTPLINPLADLFSVTQTEALTFEKARHQRPTKKVKQEFKKEISQFGLAFRFPTFEMKRDKKKNKRKNRGFIL